MADLLTVDIGDKEHDVTTLAANGYIMVKFASKEVIRHYVDMIFKPTN